MTIIKHSKISLGGSQGFSGGGNVQITIHSIIEPNIVTGDCYSMPAAASGDLLNIHVH